MTFYFYVIPRLVLFMSNNLLIFFIFTENFLPLILLQNVQDFKMPIFYVI